jgi:pullulanase
VCSRWRRSALRAAERGRADPAAWGPDGARAHWVTRDTILWPGEPGRAVVLHAAEEGGLGAPGGPRGDAPWPLVPGTAPTSLASWARHLRAAPAYRLPPAAVALARVLLRGQVAVAAVAQDGRAPALTGLQIPGVLDDLFPYDGPLGVTWHEGVPTVRLWAPTARRVLLERWPATPSARPLERIPMARDEHTGVWTCAGRAHWRGDFYRYEVEVFVPATGRVERNLVTDPYSVSLASGSRLSQLVDLDDPALSPPGWQRLSKPTLAHVRDAAVYELHVRDFSANDATVPAAHRGRYLAFTHTDSAGMRHLRALAAAGLTHVHLLPTFDFATVPDEPAERVEPVIPPGLPPDSPLPQARVTALRHVDAYNWGYDPWHYGVPEGSYATAAHGPARVLEHRAMVAALAAAGLRVVADVVFNHTHAAGQHPASVLDRIVPGYYHRLDADGAVTTSTCCPNTAAEHAMTRRLIVDTVVHWARHHRVDGFRFDLMGHHPRAVMLAVRDSLAALHPDTDGVDGTRLLLYGEGWDFGEVAGHARFVQATQAAMAGSGVATFDDRLRDAARGGSPLDDDPRTQGFATGLGVAPNEAERRSGAARDAAARTAADLVRLGLVGCLADYRLHAADGRRVTGRDLDHADAPAGYARTVGDVVSYVAAHDNETLFDAVQLKAPFSLGLEARTRMVNLAHALVALSQGIPFFHAGDDLLRSKSLDRDSYDSGDHFNRLDLSGRRSNWGVGLPPEEHNGERWPLLRELLTRLPAPAPAHMARAAAHLRELLRIRRSADLFRMRSAAQVRRRVHFSNTGPEQVPGLVVMRLDGAAPQQPAGAVVVFNARLDARRVAAPPGANWTLHPVLAVSDDPLVRRAAWRAGAFDVPALTTAVFLRPWAGRVG